MLRFVFWDVQHGHATYIKTPSDQHLVIDLGTGSYGNSGEFSPLRHLKYTSGINRLDGMVITHPHRDHLDDIFMFDDLSPRVLWRPRHLSEAEVRAGNQSADEDIVNKYLEIDRQYSGQVTSDINPFLPGNNGGVDFQVFMPNSCATSNLNNHSVVTVISYLGMKMLIPGDNEPPSWNELLEQDSFKRAIRGTDVLLAPHHGRRSAYSSKLFEHINPRLTVISDGPAGDTSATNLYSQKSQGWTAYKRAGGQENRSCVTTRNDGVIVVDFGQDQSDRNFIEVKID